MGGGRGSAARVQPGRAGRRQGKALAPPAAAHEGPPQRRRGGNGRRSSPPQQELLAFGPDDADQEAPDGPEVPCSPRGAQTQAFVSISAACDLEVAPRPDFTAPTEWPEPAGRSWLPGGVDADVDFEEGGDVEVAEAVERGQVLRMALDIRGCRLLQNAIELSNHDVQGSITRQLQGHVKEVMESPHANHVLQRAIEFMRPSSVSFVLEELTECGPAADLARHRYGCRIMERLIEHFPLGHLEPLIIDVLNETWDLTKHPFGNFVVQHLLEHGTQDHRRMIVECLLRELVSVCPHQYAVNVLDKALSYSTLDDQHALAEGVLRRPGLLLQLSGSRAGLPAAQRLVAVVKGGWLHEEAAAQLRTSLEELQRAGSPSKVEPQLQQLLRQLWQPPLPPGFEVPEEVVLAMAPAPALPPTSTAGGRGVRGLGGARGQAPCRARGGGRVA